MKKGEDILYEKVGKIAKRFDMNPSTVWRKMELMREEGVYDKIVIEISPKVKRISVPAFEAFLKGQHLAYLKG